MGIMMHETCSDRVNNKQLIVASCWFISLQYIDFQINYNKSGNVGITLALRRVSITVVLIMKANEMHYFSNLFDKVLYMFRTGPLSIIRSISTPYTHTRYFSC